MWAYLRGRWLESINLDGLVLYRGFAKVVSYFMSSEGKINDNFADGWGGLLRQVLCHPNPPYCFSGICRRFPACFITFHDVLKLRKL